MQLYRDDGIVLRTQKLGEADRIITILGRSSGRIRAVAKGVRRTKSRFGARLEPFTHVDLMLHAGRSLDVITQAEVIRPYGKPLAADYPRYTAGVAMLETAERFTPVEKEPALRQLLLLIGGLRALGGAEHDPRLVLDAFLLRSLAVAGYAPALQECARCGARGIDPNEAEVQAPATGGRNQTGAQALAAGGRSDAGPDAPAAGRRLPAFAVAAGGMVCASCRPPGAASPAAPTVALMLALLRGDWDSADSSKRRHRVECSGLVAAYLQWHLEHSIRSLRHVERVLMGRPGVRPPDPHPSGVQPPDIPSEFVPRHVALVMDGDGRWASKRGLPRTEGHKEGESSLLDVIMGAIELGIPYLSAYAFSTENWRRSPDEVRFLMGFNRDVIHRRRDLLNEMGVCIRWAGRRPRLWRSVISELETAEQMSAGNSVLTLQFCVNYGGRAEIADAAAAIAADAIAGKLRPEKIDEKVFARYLDEPAIPEVDLFVRSSGEQRLSNFLLWQSAYAELVFLDTLWPDFDRRHLWHACEIYASRDRRYGGAQPNPIPVPGESAS